MKQQGFFSDKEVKKFSLKEKFTYIFNQLYDILQPIKQSSYRGDIHCIVNEEQIPFINTVELPFTDISVKIDPLEYIEITGENFCYKFPPTMISQIWYRLRKML